MFDYQEAPPPPEQKDLLLKEDWSKATTLRAPERVKTNFVRTNHQPEPGQKLKDGVPPPLRPYTYPVVAPLAQATRNLTAKRLRKRQAHLMPQFSNFDESFEDQGTFMGGFKKHLSQAPPMLSGSQSVPSLSSTALGMNTNTRGFMESSTSLSRFCEELEEFEEYVGDVTSSR